MVWVRSCNACGPDAQRRRLSLRCEREASEVGTSSSSRPDHRSGSPSRVRRAPLSQSPKAPEFSRPRKAWRARATQARSSAPVSSTAAPPARHNELILQAHADSRAERCDRTWACLVANADHSAQRLDHAPSQAHEPARTTIVRQSDSVAVTSDPAKLSRSPAMASYSRCARTSKQSVSASTTGPWPDSSQVLGGGPEVDDKAARLDSRTP